MESFEPSDEDDERMFLPSHLSEKIIQIKQNDPDVTRLQLFNGLGLNNSTWRRLGCLLGKNTHVKVFGILSSIIDVGGLCVGLENNRSIESFWLCSFDLQEPERMISLSTFLSHNPSLKKIEFNDCSLGRDSINILSSALLKRSTLGELYLNSCGFGDIDLDKLVQALVKYKKYALACNGRQLSKLVLVNNGIGLRGCTSLAKLLANEGLALTSLHLDSNHINNEAAIVLADALATNTKLKTLSLCENAISREGWRALLKLVCNSSSVQGIVNSNHTLCDLGMQMLQGHRDVVNRSLGVDDANLLRSSLELNRLGAITSVVYCKLIWSHARGDLNLGDSSIATGAIPAVLAILGDNSDENNAHLIGYDDPVLPKENISKVRLDSVYSIIRSRPDLYERCESDAKRAPVGNRLQYLRSVLTVDMIIGVLIMLVAALLKLYHYEFSGYDILGSTTCSVLLFWGILFLQGKGWAIVEEQDENRTIY